MRVTKAIILLLLCSNICFITCVSKQEFEENLKKLDFTAVKADIVTMFTDSKAAWPADYGNYAPFFIRLAWHCAGTWRKSDGRGGCDGARQRFDPERSWADNTNLDKARTLLLPIKTKYGSGLSWGDLIILTGNMAIKSMKGPVLGFCAGRHDDDNNLDSLLLGPTAEQEVMSPCVENGKCKEPLGPTTIGLIYVNPEGPMGQPIPKGSALDIRGSFGRMSMNDEETVALIGGGHAFGKSHGACPSGPGQAPKDNEANPWKGTCGGDGLGVNTVTSGIEGPWTSKPLEFDNEYFHNLLNYKWSSHKGSGGHYQWKAENCPTTCPFAANTDGKGSQNTMMLTSDIALTEDPKYLPIVKKYDQNPDIFATDFSNAWYKLVTRDMGPHSRCLGSDVPPPQNFQYPLPAPSAAQPDFDEVKKQIIALMDEQSSLLPSDTLNNKPYYGAWFVKLAWQCASTFRNSDYLGGCNGARIRFLPQKDWVENNKMDDVISLLQTVKTIFGTNLSWADLIVLAGTTALEQISGKEYKFCGARSDAPNGVGSNNLNLMIYPSEIVEFKDRAYLMGLTIREMVALQARPRSLQSQMLNGYKGTWMGETWGNVYFTHLLSETWVSISKNELQSKENAKIYMMTTDAMLLSDATLKAIVDEYAGNNDTFLVEFQTGWTKLMNADRFDGPFKNLCYESSSSVVATTVSIVTLVLMMLLF